MCTNVQVTLLTRAASIPQTPERHITPPHTGSSNKTTAIFQLHYDVAAPLSYQKALSHRKPVVMTTFLLTVRLFPPLTFFISKNRITVSLLKVSSGSSDHLNT